MSDFENSVRDAFQEIHAPEGVRNATLAFIERHRETAGPDASVAASQTEGRPMGIIASGEQERASADANAAATQPSTRQVVTPSRENPESRLNNRRSIRPRMKRMMLAAACFIAFGIVLVGHRVYITPTAYIDLDLNPSIELSINRFDRVVGASAFNDDGKLLLDSVQLKRLKADEALFQLVSSDAFSQYAHSDSYLAISVVAGDDKQAEKLQAAGSSALAKCRCDGTCERVDGKTWRQAHGAHMGAGRYLAMQELMELDSSITQEECSHMTMRELRDRIASCSGDSAHAGAGGMPSQNGQGYGHGNGAGNGNGHGHGAKRSTSDD